MRLINAKILLKLKHKNIGNVKLRRAVDDLVNTLEQNQFISPERVKAIRKDADKVHGDGFYFFDVNVHRTMILLEFEIQAGTVVWAGTHDEYESVFKNNKKTIEKWLRNNGWIN